MKYTDIKMYTTYYLKKPVETTFYNDMLETDEDIVLPIGTQLRTIEVNRYKAYLQVTKGFYEYSEKIICFFPKDDIENELFTSEEWYAYSRDEKYIWNELYRLIYRLKVREMKDKSKELIALEKIVNKNGMVKFKRRKNK